MVTIDDFVGLVRSLPDVVDSTSFGNPSWKVGTRNFAWIRPLSAGDIKRWGSAPLPVGPTVAVRTDGLDERAAVLAEAHPGVLDFAHFAKHPALLVDLGTITREVLSMLIEDAWLASAPASLATAYLDRRGPLS